MTELSINEEKDFSRTVSNMTQAVFIIYHNGEALDNILGAYSTPDLVIQMLLENFSDNHIVITQENLEKLEIDGDAIIATKVIQPEIRVALRLLDPNIGPLVVT